MFRPLLAVILFFTTVLCWSETGWVSLSVPRAEETAALEKLQAKGIEALGWTNALVDVSAFEGIELIPLSELQTRLTPQDPRWDPWLKGIGAWFRPSQNASLLWVSAQNALTAESLVGSSDPSPTVSEKGTKGEAGPRFITGWALIALTTLYVVLMLISGFHRGWPVWNEYRRWIWAPVSATLLLVGLLFIVGSGNRTTAPPKAATVSWVQHRWFQEAWPWGAQWKNYEPGKAWSYRSYQRRDGKVAEVESTLTPADETWLKALREGMDPRSAARIFDSGNP